MNRWALRGIILLVLAGAGYWGWKFFFPPEDAVIRKRFLELAQLASFGSNEAPLAKLSNSSKLVGFFTSDAVVIVDIAGRFQHRIRGRDELLQAAMGARQSLIGLKVDFIDTTVELGPDKKVAVVNLTARARAAGEREDMIQELRFTVRKMDGEWLIDRVDTVKTLS